MAGLKILYNLILKDTVTGSGSASGILSIGKDVRKLANKKFQRYVTTAQKQGVDLDKLSEQEIKYMLELNKPKAPQVLSNEEAYAFLNKFLNQGKKDKGKVIEFPRDKITDWTKSQSRPGETEIIEGIETTKGLGDLFGRQLEKTVTVRTVIEDIKKLEPIEAMKETNKVLKGEGKYKNLSKADREKIAGDESVTDHIFKRNIIDETEDFAQGGRTGLSYLLAEDTNERMPYEEGKKVGRPKGQFWTTGKGRGEDVVDPGFDELDSETWLKIVKAAMAGDYGPIDYAGGGRVPLKDGHSPGRRKFLKIIGGLAALPVVGKLFKFAKPAAKVADVASVPIKNIEGMPAWFKPLVNKVIQEGDDVTKKWATQERQIVHKTKLPESQTDVLVHQDLNTGDVWVDIGIEKHGFASGKYGQPVRLEYKASEEIEPVINSWTGKVDTKGKKTSEEFNVEEAEFTGGHPENVKFEESTISKFGEHESDFSEVEAFATGKTKKGARNVSESFDKMNEDVADRFANYPDPNDYASGGIARMLGEK